MDGKEPSLSARSLKAHLLREQAPREQTLCVSIHDVSEATWPACAKLIDIVRQRAPIPLTLLVVPDWHRMSSKSGSDTARAEDFAASLAALAQRGHELCLHGYAHIDEGPAPERWTDWLQRRVMTRSEGEFAALDASAAAQRLQQGRVWFESRGWTPHGFVPPAWLISAAATDAVRAAGFAYMGLFRGWMRLEDRQWVSAPSLTYTTRHPLGDAIFRGIQQLLSQSQRASRWPVLRLALHPADLQRPANLDHALRVIEHCLRYRSPQTEYEALIEALIRTGCYPI